MELFKYLTPRLAVAAQLQESDMQLAAQQGFTRIINNRPDHEESGQPETVRLRAAAESAGLVYDDLPIVSGNLTDQDVEDFAQLAQGIADDTKVLMFCRTGTRCTHLWALVQAGEQGCDLEQIVATAAAAGYDLGGLRPRLEARTSST